MKKYLSIYILAAFIAMSIGFTACNDDSDSDTPLDNSAQSAVMINTFSLQPNDSILANLDSVFFSIDLNAARVFNADSLPLGTRIDSLGVSMTFSAVSLAEITMPNEKGVDTTFNYLENTSKAVNFSRGFVTLRLKSADEQSQLTYRIYVNVHKMKPDSLAWGDAAWADCPTGLAAPAEIHALEYEGKALCFSANETSGSRAVTANPALNSWTVEPLTFPAGLDINTITAAPGALYAIVNGSELYRSADMGSTWTSLGTSMTHIFGAYKNGIAGVRRNDAGNYVYATYPATTETPVPSYAPVSGTSRSITYVTEWSDEPLMIVMGGQTAAGSLVGDTWGYDGQQWSAISQNPIPGAKDMTLVPYFFFRVANNWVATRQSVLLAFGGTKADGMIGRTVYMSVDRGLHWSKAGDLMQLPSAVPSLSGAEALVFDRTMTSRAASGWNPVELPLIPAWYAKTYMGRGGEKPITEWQCPYIYLFGGKMDTGALNMAVWRGVINRLSFKPLQ